MSGVYEAVMRWIQLPWFYWFARWVFMVYAKVLFGLRRLDHERVPREGGLVLAVNHIGSLDPPVIGVTVPREISFMAKKELFENRWAALLMRGLHAFPVDRQGSDVSAVKEALRRLRHDRAIGVFIQGTRNEGDAAALDGAAYLAWRAGVPLQPAAIWREGRGYRVRFGEPFGVPGRGREAIRAATTMTMQRINELLPSHTRLPAPDRDQGASAPPPPGS